MSTPSNQNDSEAADPDDHQPGDPLDHQSEAAQEHEEQPGTSKEFSGQAVAKNQAGSVDAPSPDFSGLLSLLDEAADSRTLILKLQMPSEKIAVEVHESEKRKKLVPRIAGYIKDIVPVLTAIATIVVTIVVSYYGYQLNSRQAAATQVDLRTKVISDFAESDEKRILAAIKLSSFGEEALPAVKQSLSVDDPKIKSGGKETAKQMYGVPTLPRNVLMNALLSYLVDQNKTLRRNVMETLTEMAGVMEEGDVRNTLEVLKKHLGPQAERCSSEDENFALYAGQFLGASKPSQDSKNLLIGITNHCQANRESEDSPIPYEGARNQAVASLAILSKHFSQDECSEIIKSLHNLEARASDKLKSSIQSAITSIESNFQH